MLIWIFLDLYSEIAELKIASMVKLADSLNFFSYFVISLLYRFPFGEAWLVVASRVTLALCPGPVSFVVCVRSCLTGRGNACVHVYDRVSLRPQEA